jgi:hypothetical protein
MGWRGKSSEGRIFLSKMPGRRIWRVRRAEGHTLVLIILEQQAIKDNSVAYLTACTFNAKPVMDRINQLKRIPSIQYVSEFLKTHGISLCLPSLVTAARQEAATASNIIHWFDTVFTPTIASEISNPICFFNADEINIDFDMKTKVCKVKGDKRAPAALEETNPGHVSLMLTISANGEAPPPFFILGSLKTVPDEISSEFPPRVATFSTSPSGWQTQDTFRTWSSYFVLWVQEQRRIGRFAPTQRLLLFVDAHSSRQCPDALQLFSSNGVTVMTFPSQITHIIQPVDVAIGAPFRTYFRRILRLLMRRWKISVPESEAGRKLTAGEKRLLMIRAAIDAARQATTLTNTQSAFRATDIVTRSEEVPLVQH